MVPVLFAGPLPMSGMPIVGMAALADRRIVAGSPRRRGETPGVGRLQGVDVAHDTAQPSTPASLTPVIDIGVMSMLTLPEAAWLGVDQQRGAVCVWCDRRLSAESAIDLGHRRLDVDGEQLLCFPRACRRCGRRAALRQFRSHTRSCRLCAYRLRCRERRMIVRLALDGRR